MPAKQITWTNVKVALGDLKPWGHNPRKSDKSQRERIVASREEHGEALPFLIGPNNEVYDGHQRLVSWLEKYGKKHKVDARRSSRPLTEKERRKLVADLHEVATGSWNPEVLKTWNLQEVQGWFPKDTLKSMRADVNFFGSLLTTRPSLDNIGDPITKEEEAGAEDLQKKWKVRLGDLWELDQHRIICGDSTDPRVLKRLFKDKERAVLLHADPPYGMGKESEGVENDNLYREKLDKFQMAWWKACRPYLLNNGSAYIWGNAEDLFRLWFQAGLGSTEKLTLRDEIVWDKKSAPGMASDLMTQYVMASERCLFFQLGEQFLGNLNSDQYWEGWDDIRLPLLEEAKAAGLNPKRLQEITGVGMYQHWFSKSQWQLIPEKYYKLLTEALPGFFMQPYDKLREKYDSRLGGFRNHYNGMQDGMRSYFDNGHEIMYDIWDFPRVVGEERWGHATPKPVEMMVRIVKTSAFDGGIVLEPFIGSGSTLIGCDVAGRICRGVELSPKYIATTLERWSQITGKKPILKERTGGKQK